MCSAVYHLKDAGRSAVRLHHSGSRAVIYAEHVSVPADLGSDVFLPELNRHPDGSALSIHNIGQETIQCILYVMVVHVFIVSRAVFLKIKFIDKVQLQAV